MPTHNEKVELLAPAGNFEKLEMAVHYGADAIYLAAKEFSLRNFADNFTLDQLREAVQFCNRRNVKVYVACNVYSRNSEQAAIEKYLRQLADIRPHAIIIADPGVIRLAREVAPDMALHLSTQANTTNCSSVKFWRDYGIERVNVARELSLGEIREIASECGVEVEAFVHGAMCIAYSGRCLLSAFMAGREGNRGMCCHPCRWEYAVVEKTRPGQYMPVSEDQRGTYVFNARDLCMVEHIPDLIKAGIRSLKIEGRMKGVHYVATVVKVYREAIDAYYADPENYRTRQYWIDELEHINNRGYATGFYFGAPDSHAMDHKRTWRESSGRFLGIISQPASEGRAVIKVRNKICTGDPVEIFSPRGPAKPGIVRELSDLEGRPLTHAQPNSLVVVSLSQACTVNDLVRGIAPEV
jgi:U32 family peptidase